MTFKQKLRLREDVAGSLGGHCPITLSPHHSSPRPGRPPSRGSGFCYKSPASSKKPKRLVQIVKPRREFPPHPSHPAFSTMCSLLPCAKSLLPVLQGSPLTNRSSPWCIWLMVLPSSSNGSSSDKVLCVLPTGWSLPCWPGPSTVHHSIVTHASSCLSLSISGKGSLIRPPVGLGAPRVGAWLSLLDVWSTVDTARASRCLTHRGPEGLPGR